MSFRFITITAAYMQQPTGTNIAIIEFIEKLAGEDCDRSTFQQSVSQFDQSMYHMLAKHKYATNPVTRQLYEGIKAEAVSVKTPQQHSLIDSMLRTTIFNEQKAAKNYLQFMDQTQQQRNKQKEGRIDKARRIFAAFNQFGDSSTHNKIHSYKRVFAQRRPVIQEGYDDYLKTQLIMMEKEKGENKQTKAFLSRRAEAVNNNLVKLGGVENTIVAMETSLERHELDATRQRADRSLGKQLNKSKSNSKIMRVDKKKSSEIEKYRKIRQNIQQGL